MYLTSSTMIHVHFQFNPYTLTYTNSFSGRGHHRSYHAVAVDSVVEMTLKVVTMKHAIYFVFSQWW